MAPAFTWTFPGTPNGIRTRAAALKGRLGGFFRTGVPWQLFLLSGTFAFGGCRLLFADSGLFADGTAHGCARRMGEPEMQRRNDAAIVRVAGLSGAARVGPAAPPEPICTPQTTTGAGFRHVQKNPSGILPVRTSQPYVDTPRAKRGFTVRLRAMTSIITIRPPLIPITTPPPTSLVLSSPPQV